jgi:ABC-type polysaccharide/polyol phosphate export permease
MRDLQEIVAYRNLIYELAISDLKLRYRRSVLGFLWTMLNPLLMMMVLATVFSQVMRFAIEDYAVLLLAALLPWGFFSQSITNSLMSIVGKGSLLKKVYIPKAVIPLASVLTVLINFALSLIPLVLLVLIMGKPLTLALLFLPVATLLLAMFACGFAFLFSCLNVFFRDFMHMTDVLLQAWFYLSPIIYTVDMVPEAYRFWFELNPMFHYIQCFQQPIYHGQLPSQFTIVMCTLWGVLALLVGYTVFAKNADKFVFRV